MNIFEYNGVRYRVHPSETGADGVVYVPLEVMVAGVYELLMIPPILWKRLKASGTFSRENLYGSKAEDDD